MSRTTSPSAHTRYPMATVCRIWGVSRATLYRHRAAANAANDASWLRQRHGHKTPDQIRAEQKGLETDAATEFKLAA